MKRQPVGATCPDDGSTLRDLDGRLYCANQAHDGRPKTHPLGAAPQSSPWPDLSRRAAPPELHDTDAAGGTLTLWDDR